MLETWISPYWIQPSHNHLGIHNAPFQLNQFRGGSFSFIIQAPHSGLGFQITWDYLVLLVIWKYALIGKWSSLNEVLFNPGFLKPLPFDSNMMSFSHLSWPPLTWVILSGWPLRTLYEFFASPGFWFTFYSNVWGTYILHLRDIFAS